MTDQKKPQATQSKEKKRRSLTPEEKIAREKEKEAKFIELAEQRAPRVARAIKILGNLGNKGNYSYSAEQAKKLVDFIKDSVRSLEASFSANGTGQDAFKF